MSSVTRQADGLKKQGNAFVQRGDFASAAVLYEQAILLNPNEATYHSNLSHCYQQMGQFKKAELSARRTVRLKPQKKFLVKGYWRLGKALMSQNPVRTGLLFSTVDEGTKRRCREAAEVLRRAKNLENNDKNVARELYAAEKECQRFGLTKSPQGTWFDFDTEFDTDDYDSDEDASGDDDNDDDSVPDFHVPSEDESDKESDDEPPLLDDRAQDSDSSSDGSMPPLHDRNDSESSDESDSEDENGDGMPPLGSRFDDSSDDDSSSDDDMPGAGGRRNRNNRSTRDRKREEEKRKKKEKREAEERKKREAEERKKIEEAERQRIKAEQEEKERKANKEAERKRKKKEARQRKKLREKNGSAISTFIASHHRRNVAVWRKNTMLRGFLKFQGMVRGHLVRVETRDELMRRLECAKRFKDLWQGCIENMDSVSTKLPNWTAIRSKQRFIKRADYDYDDEFNETNKLLEDALNQAMEETGLDVDLNVDVEETSLSDNGDDDDEGGDEKKVTSEAISVSFGEHTKIRFTSDAVKWIKQGDAKYVSFFIKKMERLSRGDRSHKLAKALVGPKNKVIYETYLENKSGQRILWTEEGQNLLVWYVAKHKNVSRLANLIDNSESRSTRQRTDLTELENIAPGMLENSANATSTDISTPFGERPVVLDPLGNVPLKVYEIPAHDLENVADEMWMPPMHLTEEERKVVETEGTVLLLGRSGTGKTVCICNRMEYDRQSQRVKQNESFSQLFIARSRRLCSFVANTIGLSPETAFSTFDELLRMLNDELPEINGVRSNFHSRQMMDFARYKRDVHKAEDGLDPLLVWTNIRSFIKGSIDAVKSLPRLAVSREEYISSDVFRKVCRVKPAEMETVYDIYTRYEKYMQDHDLWDNCDRMMALLQRLISSMTTHPDIFYNLRKTKIYVDEIQDYTQAEILMFFHLAAGLGDLFLAGDPAQSVAEGIEFRFEDIRSVAYYIVGGDGSKKGKNIPGIPNKPKTVNVNFRSHAGVLNTAGDILSLMFGAFPDSATELKEDKGLFSGPRPGVYDGVEADRLSTLVSEKLNGIVILTHDEKVTEWKNKLEGYPLVYGIRSAKGLEFKRVILLDFFSDLPTIMLEPWRELILGRAKEDFKVKFPEIEGHLKLLYTAVTRCIEQLFFAETKETIAGNAFIRWITTNTVKNGVKPRNVALATRNNVSDIEKMTLTRDEWLASGIENAEVAESDVGGDLEKAIQLLDRAKYCFQEAKEKDDELFLKAHAHLESVKFISQLPPMVFGDENANVDEDIETKGAQIVGSLLSQGLLTATEDLCRNISPYLSSYSRRRLEEEFISQLAKKNL